MDNKIEEVKKILERHDKATLKQGKYLDGCALLVAMEICQLFEDIEKRAREKLIGEKADFGLSIHEAAWAQARNELLQKLSGYFRDDGELHKGVIGALRDMINVHGEINSKNLSSAAKRITHQIASTIKDKKKWQAQLTHTKKELGV